MNWARYTVEDRKIPGISGFAIIMILISIYIQSKLVLFSAVFFLVVAIANQFYLKRAGNQLHLENEYVKNRFFIGDSGQWILKFSNVGYPILKGELRIYFDDFVVPLAKEEKSIQAMFEIEIPFSIFVNQTKQISIPFAADKRGIAKIRKVELHVPSMLGFGEIVLESNYYLKQQAVVYPKPIPLKGLRQQLSVLQGAASVPYSVFKDRLGPMGTKDYTYSDSFNQIHWKASARKQTLQTKVFDKVSNKSWNIALNISDGHSITGKLEKFISCLTDFAFYAYQQQISYSLCINVRTVGGTPFLYLPKGEGSEHLQNVLEVLASISTQNTSLPYDYVLSHYNRHFVSEPFFIHAGNRTAETNEMLLKELKKGVQLFELKINKDSGFLDLLEIQTERRLPV